jgi:excisionase family DNA binding protein
MQQEQFIDISEAAKHLGVHEMFLRRRVSDRWNGLKPRFYRIGGVKGRLRFRKSELDAYMQAYEGISPAINAGNKETVTAVE